MQITINNFWWLPKGRKISFWLKKSCCTCSQERRQTATKNYRPISLLPICSKIFERLIYNELFTFFTDNNLNSPNQPGFRHGDSCVNQLITITHKIYKSFDERLEVRRVFLDILKAFDKVWHNVLLLKLYLNGLD